MAPRDAVDALRAYLSYESSVGFGRPGPRRFSLAVAGYDVMFLQHDVQRRSSPTQRPVYVFRAGNPLFAAGCPADAEWPACSENGFRDAIHESVTTSGVVELGCDISVTIGNWRPTPASERKRALASEVLQELFQFGYVNPKVVFVRDFNVSDPELNFYVVDAEGKDNLQGCSFTSNRRPHCVWHLYGQSPLAGLRQEIMARPYKLYPPEPTASHPGK